MNNELTMTKTYNCRVRFEGYDWNNIFSVNSPTGRGAVVHCNGQWDKMSPALLALINKYQYADESAFMWGASYPEALTAKLMREILALAEAV
jgi:hypothetical protein